MRMHAWKVVKGRETIFDANGDGTATCLICGLKWHESMAELELPECTHEQVPQYFSHKTVQELIKEGLLIRNELDRKNRLLELHRKMIEAVLHAYLRDIEGNQSMGEIARLCAEFLEAHKE